MPRRVASPDAPPTLGERARYVAARAVARLPAPVQWRLASAAPVVLDGRTLDPMVAFVRTMRRREHRYGLFEPTVPEGRGRFRRETSVFRGPATAVGEVREVTVPGAGGPLRARHYVPPGAGAGAAPLVVYLHGGGYVIGDLDTHDEPCRLLCRGAATHVLSVDYRLAPEHPFPAGLEDARAALRWARANAAALGADPARVSIGGDSAGANLATVVARLEARAGTPPAAQLLIYPPTDEATPRPSWSLFGDDYFLDLRDRHACGRFYLEGTGVPGADPRVSPLRAPDLAALPPALVVTAGFDILRDEGEAYAAALHAAGSAATLLRFDSLVHGFIHMTGVVPAARRAMRQVASVWRAIA